MKFFDPLCSVCVLQLVLSSLEVRDLISIKLSYFHRRTWTALNEASAYMLMS